MDRLDRDERLVLSGASAARQLGADIVARNELEAYVRRADLDDVVNDHKLSPALRPKVMLRAVEGHWPFAHGERIAPDAVVALDLLESDDDRSRRAGREVLDKLIAEYA